MQDNPYSMFVSLMREEGKHYNTPSFFIGEIVAGLPNIKVKIDNIQLDNNDLYINDFLLAGYKRSYSLSSTTASGSTTDGSINNISIPNGEYISLAAGFDVGDKVLMLSTDDKQKFVILNKVVKL